MTDRLRRTPTVWLTADEVSTRIHKSKRTLLNAVYLGNEGIGRLIPQSTRLGGRRVWDSDAVDAWIKASLAASRREARKRRARNSKKEGSKK